VGYSTDQTEPFEVDTPVGIDHDDCGGGITKVKFTWSGFELWLSDTALKNIQYGSMASATLASKVPEIGFWISVAATSISGGISYFREYNHNGIIIYHEWLSNSPMDILVVAQSPQ